MSLTGSGGNYCSHCGSYKLAPSQGAAIGGTILGDIQELDRLNERARETKQVAALMKRIEELSKELYVLKGNITNCSGT